MLTNILDKFRQQRNRGKLIKTLTSSEEVTKLIAQEESFNREVMIVGLTAATAILHIKLAAPIFVLNGVGFLALLAAHYTVPERESYQKYTRDALFGYTAFTVVGYFVKKGVGGWTQPNGVALKLIELGLMKVLWEDRKAARHQTSLVAEISEEMKINTGNLSAQLNPA